MGLSISRGTLGQTLSPIYVVGGLEYLRAVVGEKKKKGSGFFIEGEEKKE